MTDTHETDQLIAVLTDALEIYGRPDDGLPQHLAAVIRREFNIDSGALPDRSPVRLWDGQFNPIGGGTPIDMRRGEDDRRVIVFPKDAPIVAQAASLPPQTDLHLTVDGPTFSYNTRWGGRVTAIRSVPDERVKFDVQGYAGELKLIPVAGGAAS